MHQMFCYQRQIPPKGIQGQLYLVILDHVVQSIGTKENDVTGTYIVIVNLDIDLGINPKRPGHQISVFRVPRLFGRNNAIIKLFL